MPLYHTFFLTFLFYVYVMQRRNVPVMQRRNVATGERKSHVALNAQSQSLKKYYKLFFPCDELFKFFDLFERFKKLEMVFQTMNEKYPRCQSIIKSGEEFRNALLNSLPMRVEIIGKQRLVAIKHNFK